MPIDFNLRVAGTAQLNLALRQIPIRDWTACWPKVTAALSEILANQFATQGARGPHGEWAALDPEYAKRKQKKYPGAPILQASRRLWRSLVTESGDTIDERWPQRLRWGTALPYALYQQTGFPTRLGTGKQKAEARPGAWWAGGRRQKAGKAFVEARPIFDLIRGEADKAIARVMMTWAATQFRRLGFAIAKEYGMEVTPGEARLMGRSIYASEVPVAFP